MDNLFGKEFKLIPVYIARTSKDGRRIWVSPWGDNNEIEATVLSPIPTDIIDGRRFMGFPSSREETGIGDSAMCAVVDGRYYILGYFNLPDYTTAEKIILDKEDAVETLPLKNGVIFKISEFSHIVWRKSNWIRTWLGEWSNQTMKGFSENPIRDETIHTKFKNIVETAWGGFTKWTRKKEGDDELAFSTEYKAVYTKTHEPELLSDVDKSQKEKNPNIDDTTPSVPPVAGRPYNSFDLPYIDKVIKRAGTIDDDTHVYEREVRQSINEDKEKTGFTRLREGNREGVLSEYETDNVIEFTHTSEKIGANIGGAGNIIDREYIQRDKDELVLAQLSETFGSGDITHEKTITDSAGNYVKSKQTVDGLLVTVADIDDTNIVTLLVDHLGNVTLDASNIVTVNAINVNLNTSTNVNLTAEADVNLTASAKVVVEAPNIEIGQGSTEHLVLGEALVTWLANYVNTTFGTHIHGTGVGPTTPPTTPFVAPVASDFLSEDHTTK